MYKNLQCIRISERTGAILVIIIMQIGSTENPQPQPAPSPFSAPVSPSPVPSPDNSQKGVPGFDFTSPPAPPYGQPFSTNPVFDSSTHHTPHRKQPASHGGVLGPLMVLGALLLKAKGFLGFLKFGKLFTTMGTMLLSVWFYALIWGWKFAAGFVILIFVHEMGHVIAARWKNIPVSAPMFIPGLGALITLKEEPRDALTEAYVGYGGPLLGTLGAMVTWGLYYLTGDLLWLALTTTGLMLNLFNMIPVSPLDGGRITAAVSPWLWGVGLVGLLAWFLQTHSPIMLIILILGAFRFFDIWKNRKDRDAAYYQVAPNKRILVAVLYVGLAAYLGWSQHYTHLMLEDFVRSHPAARNTWLES